MPELTGLTGVKRKTVPCKSVFSFTEALRVVTRRRAVIAADDNGSISVWIDDSGSYRAEFFRHLISHGSIVTTGKRALRDWLREWWPKMSRDNVNKGSK